MNKWINNDRYNGNKPLNKYWIIQIIRERKNNSKRYNKKFNANEWIVYFIIIVIIIIVIIIIIIIVIIIIILYCN